MSNMPEKTMATVRTRCRAAATSAVTRARDPSTKRNASAKATGKASKAGRSTRITSGVSIITSPSFRDKHQPRDETRDAQDHRQRVELHEPVLDRSDQDAQEARDRRDQPDQVVHHGLEEPANPSH